MKLPKIGRRRFIGGLGASAAALSIAPRLLFAQEVPEHRFVSLYFSGGWDILYGADPRDPAQRESDWTVQLPGNYFDADRDGGYSGLLPVNVGGTETFFHPSLRHLAPHTDVLTLFRGVNMNTVAHNAGRAYMNTFKAPAGAVAQGDSMGTLFAASSPWGDYILPNVSIGMPSFNVKQGVSLTGVRLGNAGQSTSLLTPLGEQFDDELGGMLRAAQDELQGTTCVASDYLDLTPADQSTIARDDLRRALEAGVADEFSFDTATRERYGVTRTNDPGFIGATVSRFIHSGLSKSVSAQIQSGFDGHREDVFSQTPGRLAAAGQAIAALLDDLRRDDPNMERTTVLLHSEFGRTPQLNGTRGRDHWLANTIFVFGGGLRGGVIGSTYEKTLERRKVDGATGLPSESDDAFLIKPEHIGATLAYSVFGEEGYASQDISRVFRVDPLTNLIA